MQLMATMHEDELELDEDVVRLKGANIGVAVLGREDWEESRRSQRSESSMITTGTRLRSSRISSTSRSRLATKSARGRSTAGSATVSWTSSPIDGSSQPSASFREKSCLCVRVVLGSVGVVSARTARRVGFRNSVRGLIGGLGWLLDTFALP